MTDDLFLRRKWTLRAHGQQVIFVKQRNERSAHVLMKALLWALYLPVYPELTVEIRIGDRFKPDVVDLDPDGRPRFWGEAGQVSVRKLRSLLRRYPETHFAFSKWATNLAPHAAILTDALAGLNRRAPVDLMAFPADSVERFVHGRGEIRVSHDDLKWFRIGERTE